MKIQFEGVDKVMAALDKVQKKTKGEANKLVAGAAMRTSAMAKIRLQPQGDSRELAFEIAAVRQSINFTHDASKVEAKVFAGNTTGDHMAAYLEFGTGRHAAGYVPTLPQPFQQLARRYYVNGKGTLKVHAYLVPSFLQEGKRLSEKLKNLKVSW